SFEQACTIITQAVNGSISHRPCGPGGPGGGELPCRRGVLPGRLWALPPGEEGMGPGRPGADARITNRGLAMTANGSVLPENGPGRSVDTPLPGARAALLLLLTINLFNYIDRQVLAAVVPEIRRELFEAPGAPAVAAGDRSFAVHFVTWLRDTFGL